MLFPACFALANDSIRGPRDRPAHPFISDPTEDRSTAFLAFHFIGCHCIDLVFPKSNSLSLIYYSSSFNIIQQCEEFLGGTYSADGSCLLRTDCCRRTRRRPYGFIDHPMTPFQFLLLTRIPPSYTLVVPGDSAKPIHI